MDPFSDDESSHDASLGFGDVDLSDNRKRNLDRRRETSRYAARDRRGKEADIFTDLKDVVPIVEETTVTHVDRIALLRVASTMCRMRRNAAKFLVCDLPPEEFGVHAFCEQSLTECLDGFVLLADSDGTILYVSESVSVFLGLTQTDLVGRFLKEFVHNNDYDELIRASTTSTEVEDTASSLDEFGRYMVLRMKTVISPRGRNLNLKSALYKAILCRFRAVTTEYGRLSLIYGSSTPAGQGNSIMLANAAVKGSEATNGVYMTRHTCDMRFSYVSDSLNYLLRHDARSLMGTSFYDIVHPCDIAAVAQSMQELFQKGHCRTPFYRLLGSNNSVAWVQTEATTVNHTARGQKGQYVLCVHSVVGMQSEEDVWADLVVDNIGAANPAFCAAKIKHEIPDMVEYMGRQPEFVDCVDFTPLIEPITDVNFADFNQANLAAANVQPASETRKKSFDEVLDWLVRDEADSPPPYASFLDARTGDVAECSVPDAECGASRTDSDPTLASASIYDRDLFFRGQPGCRPAGQQHMRGSPTSTSAMAQGNRPQCRALPPQQHQSIYAGPRGAAPTAYGGGFGGGRGPGRDAGASLEQVEQHQYAGAGFEQISHAQRQQLQQQPAYQRLSRLGAHVRQQVGEPSRVPQGSSIGAAFVRSRSANSGAVSPPSTADFYSVPGPDFRNTARRVSGASPAMHAPLHTPSTPHSPARTRASSTSSTRSVYDISAARRYAQASPAVRGAGSQQSSTCRATQLGRPSEPREQRTLNVNQLNAITSPIPPLDLDVSSILSPNANQAFHNANHVRPAAPIPMKKLAYGGQKPVYNDDCSNLAHLAPFVPADDCVQLEDLDLRGMFPDVDFSEFFPAEQGQPNSTGSAISVDDKRSPPVYDEMYRHQDQSVQVRESVVPEWSMDDPLW